MEEAPLILLVEDDEAIRDTLAECLEAERYRVAPAHNGAAALERLRGGPRPDLVILDLVMPVMDGATFLERMRGDGAFRDIPVVLMTGATSAAGTKVLPAADAVITKPFDLDALLEVVAHHLHRK